MPSSSCLPSLWDQPRPLDPSLYLRLLVVSHCIIEILGVHRRERFDWLPPDVVLLLLCWQAPRKWRILRCHSGYREIGNRMVYWPEPPWSRWYLGRRQTTRRLRMAVYSAGCIFGPSPLLAVGLSGDITCDLSVEINAGIHCWLSRSRAGVCRNSSVRVICLLRLGEGDRRK